MKRRTRKLLAISALAVLLPFGVASVGAATVTTPEAASAAGLTTSFDRVVDLIMQQRVAVERLSAADARIAREQMQLQFLSLSKAEQQKLLDATRSLDSGESVIAARKALHNAVSSEARQVMAEIQAADRAKLASGQMQGGSAKLGPGSSDLVFVATVGPCRVFDSRNGPGQLAGFGARQVYGYSDNPFYLWSFDQGGTGQAGSGNCTGTVYPGVVVPVSVVATVAVVNTLTTGSMRAWNGGTNLTVGGILGWNAGNVLSNTTVIPMDRFIAAYPGSGGKRDFGVFNNSPTPIDFIVDVVGYFIMNEATALDCTAVTGVNTPVNPGTSVLINAPACAAGYTAIVAQPGTNVFGVYTGTLSESLCRINNTTGAVVNVQCQTMCCRVPGR